VFLFLPFVREEILDRIVLFQYFSVEGLPRQLFLGALTGQNCLKHQFLVAVIDLGKISSLLTFQPVLEPVQGLVAMFDYLVLY
jgi:hypothetical protein